MSEPQLIGINHDLVRTAIDAAVFDLVGEAEAFCRARLAEFAEDHDLTLDEGSVKIRTIYRRWDPEFKWTDSEGEVQKGDFFPANEIDYTDLRLMASAYASPGKKVQA